jgi:hypothetical protein
MTYPLTDEQIRSRDAQIRRWFEERKAQNTPALRTGEGGSTLASIRLANDQRSPGNLLVLVMGPGPFPLMSFSVPRAMLDELLVDESPAIVQCHPNTLGVSLHFPAPPSV